ncbi:MAG: extracellular solute-binding protein family 1 [Paenibacillus sp.]|jgi:multiple sugar transport system substrate-binding protein|nr:extracellular solute-binding protein family 1 [Paenibacillus sp.]
MKTKTILTFISTICVITSLAACGKDSATEKESKAKSTVATPTEQVEIVFYGASAQPQEFFDQQYGELLYKKFPQYKFKYIQKPKEPNYLQYTTELITAGERFDIYYNNIGIFENTIFPLGLQYDMTDLMKKHNVNLNQLEQESVNAMRQFSEGKTYGIPVTDMKFALFYNKDIFDKFGVSYPKDGLTWDQALDMSKKLTRYDNGKQYFGISTSPNQYINQNQLSIPLVDSRTEKPTINTNPSWRKLFDIMFVQPMQDVGVKAAINELKRVPNYTDFVMNQNVALLPYNIAVYLDSGFITVLKTYNWDMVTVPVFPEAPGVGSQTTPFYFGLTNMAKQKDAAMEVLKYMISDEYQMWVARRGFIPTLPTEAIKKEYGKETAFPDKNYAALFKYKNASIPPSADYTSALNGIYGSAALSIANGTKDINTAFRDAEEMALKRIEETKMNRAKK